MFPRYPLPVNSVLNLYQTEHTGCKTLPQNQCKFIPTSRAPDKIDLPGTHA
jgi:hypothetical protein